MLEETASHGTNRPKTSQDRLRSIGQEGEEAGSAISARHLTNQAAKKRATSKNGVILVGLSLANFALTTPVLRSTGKEPGQEFRRDWNRADRE